MIMVTKTETAVAAGNDGLRARLNRGMVKASDFSRLSREEAIERLDDARDLQVAAVNAARMILADVWRKTAPVLLGADDWLAAHGVHLEEGETYDWPADETCIPNVPPFVDEFERLSEPRERKDCHECGNDFVVDASGVAHHVADGGIDHDQDGDHVPFTLEG